ncbi:MAG: hypothetical protein VB009_01785 [Erysipelotrichaceae bacterium]|nr:hypothetical protein [Erysipelotrichaceae bacterium]
MVDFTNLILCDEKTTIAYVYVSASLTKGCFLISGQDIGEDLEKYFGKDEHEYFYAFDKENTKRLSSLLRKENADIKKVLLNKFAGLDGCAALRTFCEKNNIEYDLSTY